MDHDVADKDRFAERAHDRLAEWRHACGPWRPHPLSRPGVPIPRATRLGVLSGILVAHVLAFWWLGVGSRYVPDARTGRVTTVVFIAPEVEVIPEPQAAPAPRPVPREPARTPTAPPSVVPGIAPPSTPPPVEERPPDAGTPGAIGPAPVDRPLQLYAPDGTLVIPDDVVARLAAVDADDRPFEFRLPGVVESGRFLDRPPALAFESTRFDAYWIPEKDALTRILEKAVEATTDYIEIPIPGTRGGKIVCTVSLLALGGGCGVKNNSNGYVVRGDDPETLSPAEDAQCRAWWDQIVAAREQEAWRHTRALYDASCRKPLAKEGSMPVRG